MRRVTPYLMLLPMMLLVGLLLASLGDGLLQSLGYFPPAGLTSFTLDYYRAVLQDPALHGSVLYSLYLAFTSALLSTAGGVALSALLVACKRPDSLLLRLPITIPHTVAQTNLSQRRRGDPVNLETDVVGKYIEKLLRPEETKPHTPANESTLTKEMLLRCGF